MYKRLNIVGAVCGFAAGCLAQTFERAAIGYGLCVANIIMYIFWLHLEEKLKNDK